MAEPEVVAALLLNYRRAGLTRTCLRDLLQAEGARLRVLLLDNGSGDGSSEELERAADEARHAGHAVETLALPANVGYGAAMNRGLAWAAEQDAAFVLLLNNDLRLPPDFLSPLVSVLRNDPGIAAVGPTILQPDGTVWAQGGRLGFRPNALTLRGQGRPPLPRRHGPEAVDFLPGACLLARLPDLLAVGGFDEEWFLYWEDVDLCRRLRARGKVLWLPWVHVTHLGAASSGGGRSPLRKYAMAANEVRWVLRHGSPSQWLAFLLLDVALLPLAILRAPRAGLAKLRGLLAGLLGRKVSAADVARYSAAS